MTLEQQQAAEVSESQQTISMEETNENESRNETKAEGSSGGGGGKKHTGKGKVGKNSRPGGASNGAKILVSSSPNANANGNGNGGGTNSRATPSSRATTSKDGDDDDESHRASFAKVQKAQEKYRAMSLQDMVKDRGEKLVIIQPGSEILRIGLASEPDFVEVPNCVAYRKHETQPKKRQRRNEQEEEGSSNASGVDETLRDTGCRTIETLLGMSRASRKSGKPMDLPVLESHGTSEPSERGTDGKKSDFDDADGTGGKGNARVLFGEEALAGASSGDYDLHFCIRNGHLYDAGTPVTTMKSCLCEIWSWAIHSQLNIEKKDLPSYSCLVLVSNVMDKREVRDMIDVVLKDLGMLEVAIHSESVASVFTHACPVACVVHVDTHVTSVMCIEDGQCVGNSKVVLPYGRWDVLNLMKDLLGKHQCWPFTKGEKKEYPGGAGWNSIEEFKALRDIYLNCCSFEIDSQASATQQKVAPESNGKKVGSTRRISNEITLGVQSSSGRMVDNYKLKPGCYSKLAPVALYVPTAFGLTRREAEERSLDHVTVEFEDGLDEFMLDALQNKDSSNPFRRLQKQPEQRSSPQKRDEVIGLDQAIVKSIVENKKPELKNRLFENIIFVGDATCELPGCIAMLESRVLHAIPAKEAVSTVNVLQPQVDRRESVFKGGALLGILDLVQENWIQRDVWLTGGIQVGAQRKLSRMNKLTLQLLWHGAY